MYTPTILKFEYVSDPTEGLLNYKLSSWFIKSGKSPRVGITNKFPDNADAAGLGTIL